MKKLIAGLFALALISGFSAQSAKAVGLIYNEVIYPTEMTLTDGKSCVRHGTSSAINVLGLVEIGDAGTKAAMKNGNISRIHHIDVEHKGWFIVRKFITHVYGE